MKARVVLFAACAALVVATCLLNFLPGPDRFPFLQGIHLRLLEEHDIEMWSNGGHRRLHVRTYALESPRRSLHWRLANSLNGSRDWKIGGMWISPGFAWSTKDGSTGLTLSRFPPTSPSFKNGGRVNPEGYVVTYETKPLTMADRFKQWWRLHRI